MNLNKNLGKVIKRIRLSKNLTQKDVAKLAGISLKYYGTIERGKSSPSLKVVFKISLALEKSLSELFSEMKNK